MFVSSDSVFTQDVFESGLHWTGYYDLDDPDQPVA